MFEIWILDTLHIEEKICAKLDISLALFADDWNSINPFGIFVQFWMYSWIFFLFWIWLNVICFIWISIFVYGLNRTFSLSLTLRLNLPEYMRGWMDGGAHLIGFDLLYFILWFRLHFIFFSLFFCGIHSSVMYGVLIMCMCMWVFVCECVVL